MASGREQGGDCGPACPLADDLDGNDGGGYALAGTQRIRLRKKATPHRMSQPTFSKLPEPNPPRCVAPRPARQEDKMLAPNTHRSGLL